MVHTWGIFIYTLRFRQGSNFLVRKNDSRPLNQRFLILCASLIFVCVWHRPTFFSGRLREDLSLHDFCLRKTVPVTPTTHLYRSRRKSQKDSICEKVLHFYAKIRQFWWFSCVLNKQSTEKQISDIYNQNISWHFGISFFRRKSKV